MSSKPTAKIDIILKHLKRVNGAKVSALQKATGWKPSSIRAALSRMRKKGFHIECSNTAKGVTVYRVVE